MPARRPHRIFTPEERASYDAWRFGGTLDWCNHILVALKYPVETNRWFVDAVQGICKGKEQRIAHSMLAKRAQRFKNVEQAKALARRGIETDREWARGSLRMIFDVETPKPRECEGQGKRARTRYTDYLTPAAVWAQATEHKVKKSDPERWKTDTEYRLGKRREILAEALKLLPGFDSEADMPADTRPKEKQALTLSEYVEQREKILLAESRRILDRLCDGELTDADEIDDRLATLEVAREKILGEIREKFESTREVLLGLRKTRLVRAMDFTDPQEVVAGVDAILDRRGYAGDPPILQAEAGADVAPEQAEKGYAGDPLTENVGETHEHAREGDAGVPPAAESGESQACPEQAQEHSEEGYAGIPLPEAPAGSSDAQDTAPQEPPTPPKDNNKHSIRGCQEVSPEASERSRKGDAGVPLVQTAPQAPAESGKASLLLTWALYWAAQGLPVLPLHSVFDGICSCREGSECRSPGKHPRTENGVDDASTSEGQVRAWWRKWPEANIGGAMGGDLRLLAVDIDPRNGGGASLYDLTEAHGDEWFQTLQHKTGGGGHHFFYTIPEGISFSKGKLAPGIDLKHSGGYVVLPPSLHASGFSYRIDNAVSVSPAPPWLVEELTRSAGVMPSKPIKYQERHTTASAAGRMFLEGERNDGLFRVGYGRWVNGWAEDAEELYAQLLEVRDRRCAAGSEPVTDREVRKMADHIATDYPRGVKQKEGGSG